MAKVQPKLDLKPEVKASSKALEKPKATVCKSNVQVIANKIVRAERTRTALMKDDKFHRAASYLSEDHIASGKVFNITGGDGVIRTLLQVEGQIDDIVGIFEYILDSNGKISHQLFKPGGVINGIPN